jgi:phosphotransferase system enzyme I (PtsP)
LFVADEEHLEYVLSATVGTNEACIGQLRLKFGQGLVGFIAEREEPINLDHASAHEAYLDHPELAEKDYLAYMGVPLIFAGGCLGVITVQSREQQCFTESQEASLVTIAVQLAAELNAVIARGALAEVIVKKKTRRRKTETYKGVPGVPGVAIGTAVVVYPPADLDAVPDRETEAVEAEVEHFRQALDAARDEIQELHGRAEVTLTVAESALFDAYLRILESRSLTDEVTDEIKKGQWAQGALRRVIKRYIAQFESLDDEYLRERATDMRDLGRRILAKLQTVEGGKPSYPKRTVLISEELTATALMEVPQGCIVGIVSGAGSNNSHVSILARALGLPAIMGVGGIGANALSAMDGKEIIVDGYNGDAYIAPTQALKKEFRHLAAEEQQLDDELDALREKPAETTDGFSVSLLVNTGLAAEAGLSVSVAADGVGLYRTEMAFMMRERFPSEEEQRITYSQLLNTFAPRPVVMRTLDIGGDKALPYFPIEEENPFLGWRGVRVTLDQPEIFLQQVRAMIQASAHLENLAIMLPMVSSLSDVEHSKQLITQAFSEVKEEGFDVSMPPLGIMIEVPSAVYQAYELARCVDFMSVGTNDLIQYLLAVDRNNPRVAGRYDGLHPAVLRALKQVVDAGHKAGVPVGICGELAADPLVVLLLVAMGFDSLSMNARSLLRVKYVMRSFSMKEARKMLAEVLRIDDAKEVRLHMETVLENAGLAGLIRAGL